MATLVNKDAPYSGLSSLMALRGRGGDTELVHMSKPEVRGLASLGELTINPDTGLPEAFKLKSILPTIAGLAAAYFTGGSSLLIPALATGTTSAIVNKDIGRGLFDGLLSYAGGSIMQGLGGGEALAGAANAGSAGSAIGATAPQTVAATGGSAAQSAQFKHVLKAAVQRASPLSRMLGLLVFHRSSSTMYSTQAPAVANNGVFLCSRRHSRKSRPSNLWCCSSRLCR
jgi:hypothetical protein